MLDTRKTLDSFQLILTTSNSNQEVNTSSFTYLLHQTLHHQRVFLLTNVLLLTHHAVFISDSSFEFLLNLLLFHE